MSQQQHVMRRGIDSICARRPRNIVITDAVCAHPSRHTDAYSGETTTLAAEGTPPPAKYALAPEMCERRLPGEDPAPCSDEMPPAGAVAEVAERRVGSVVGIAKRAVAVGAPPPARAHFEPRGRYARKKKQ